MATKYEYYDTGADGADNISLAHVAGQTFTPLIAHRITIIKLLLSRWVGGSPGTVSFGITEVDGEGKPTGDDLCSGTTDGNTLPEDPASEWRAITLGAGAILYLPARFGIVCENPEGSYVIWRLDKTSPTYAGGERVFRDNAEWTVDPSRDFLFEEWGEPIAVPRSFGLIIG